MTTNEKIAYRIKIDHAVLTPYNWEVINYFNNYGHQYIDKDAAPFPSMFGGKARVTNAVMNCQLNNPIPEEVRDLIDKYHPGFMADCGNRGIIFRPVDCKVIWESAPRDYLGGLHITISVFDEDCLLIEQAGAPELRDFIITPITKYELIQTILLHPHDRCNDFNEEDIYSYIESTFGIKMKRFN